jgi:hypothetical protein
MADQAEQDGDRSLDWRRRLLVAAGVAGGAIAVGAVLGLLLAGGDSGPSRSEEIAKLPALAPAEVVAAPRASPERLDEPRGLGSLHAGVALLAVEEVDEVHTVDGRRRAPEGSTLLAFRVGDWTCEEEPCAPWRSLAPALELEGAAKPLPAVGDTFVAVLPPGAEAVDLVVEADGYTQSISLTEDAIGPDNIVLLADDDRPGRVPVDETFRLVERTSVALDDGAGGLTDRREREVGVEYAQLRFFLHGTVPSSPRRAFLVVNAYYSYPGRAGTFILAPGEVVLEDEDGNRYDARDVDPSEAHGLLGFEVPATLRSGTLVIGGSLDKVSTTGVPYVQTLPEQRVPISLD